MAGPGRDRAQIACIACHNRKVRCNWQESLDGVCRHCRRYKQRCVIRETARTRQLGVGMSMASPGAPSPSADRTTQAFLRRATTSSPTNVADRPGDGAAHIESCSSEASGQPCWVGENSFLRPGLESSSTRSNDGFVPQFIPIKDSIIQLTDAAILPKAPLLSALMDSFFRNVYPRYPVVDREDLATAAGSSVLLQQAISMAGSLMRRSNKPRTLSVTHAFYEKAKVMIYLNHESDPLAVLSAMCLMICWSTNNSDALSLDCPWHWTGSGIRVALQMGLHRESTYTGRPQAGRLRRLWWVLMNADRLQSVCFGRPRGISRSDFDTKLPSMADFAHPTTANQIFIHYASLLEIMVDIYDANGRGRDVFESVIDQLTASLARWIRELPEEIRLYDSSGQRRPYCASISDLHICYFVVVILLEALHTRQAEELNASVPAVIASSCMIRLFEEIDCQEDVGVMLSPTTWYILVAAIPQLHYRPHASALEELRQEELEILSPVIEQLRTKYGGADAIRRRIEQIKQDFELRPPRPADNGPSSTSEGLNGAPFHPRQGLAELFPFPKTLCPNMELLGTDVDNQPALAMTFLPFGNDAFSWTANESQSCLDIFGIHAFTEFDPFDSSMGSINAGALDLM